MSLRNIRLTLQYDGSDFHGWQRQPGVRTVQGELEKALELILRTPIVTEGASRTDAGVHALGQVANFTTETDMQSERIAAAVNSKLPADVAVIEASDADPEFSSRFRAQGKIYRYFILNSRTAAPALRRYVLHEYHELDVERMSSAARLIRGERDYVSFGAQTAEDQNTVCDIQHVTVTEAACPLLGETPGRLLRIEVMGNRFLYKMVRTVAGTLLEAGKGRFEPADIAGIIEARDRGRAGPTLKPHGLYLVKVLY
jgi:tRNA pseudouridine38-40 synthase